MKILLRCIAVLIAISVIVFKFRYDESQLKNKILAENYCGVITSKYKDSTDHNVEMIIVGNSMHYIISNPIWYKIAVGDSIVKNLNTFKYYIVRNHDTITFFQTSGGNEIK